VQRLVVISQTVRAHVSAPKDLGDAGPRPLVWAPYQGGGGLADPRCYSACVIVPGLVALGQPSNRFDVGKGSQKKLVVAWGFAPFLMMGAW